MSLPRSVQVIEVGPRDGLQNESAPVATGDKIAFIDALSVAKPIEIEVTSFVSPRAVPQLADAEEVLRGIRRHAGVRYSALVPNLQGLERALRFGLDRIALFTAASESFNQRNIRASVRESIERFRPVADAARAAGIPLRGYISTAFVCPFEGAILPAKVIEVTRMLLDLGVEEVSFGDTIGAAVPTEIDRLLTALDGVLSVERIALHLHDTRGTALANVLAGLRRGVTIFDCSAGGLGGCPFAPGASGNLATEDLHYFLTRMGVDTGLEPKALQQASDLIEASLGHPLPSRVRRARAAAPPP
jgi:hydroxymethylglutaryl-CoA lyase